MTQTERNAIVSPANGLLIYQPMGVKASIITMALPGRLLPSGFRGLSNNIFIGATAGNSNPTTTGNIGLGRAALYSNTDRIENIAIGDSSQFATGVGSFGNQAYYNTSVGSKSMRFSTTGAKCQCRFTLSFL